MEVLSLKNLYKFRTLHFSKMEKIADDYFKKVLTTMIIAGLLILGFFLLRPVILSIIMGLILAFLFSPIYEFLYMRLKSRNLATTIICIFLAIIIILPVWFLTPIFIEQSLKMLISVQQIDYVTPLKTIFPSFFASEEFSRDVAEIIATFVTKSANQLTTFFTNIVFEFPRLFLQFLVFIFTFYYALRDKELFTDYLKSILPFSKDIEKKLFENSRSITISVIYGHLITGIIQGLIVGTGLFIFGIPNALFLTFLAMILGVLPILGPPLIYVPVAIYSILAGNNTPAFGVLFFGIISSVVDNFIRMFIIAKRTSIHSSIVLIGMVGGLIFFGVLGLILGPLILAYVLIILEIFRDKKLPGVIIEPEKQPQ